LVQGIGTSPIAAAKDLLGKLFSEDAVACQTAKRGASNWATAAFGLAKHCTESVQWLQRAQAWSIRKEQVHDETLHAQVKLTVGLRTGCVCEWHCVRPMCITEGKRCSAQTA
jgi:hypothetical protein